jgi:hypothetical protein
MKFSLVLSLLFLFGCSTISEKPEVTDTSSIRVSSSQCGPTLTSRVELEKLGESIVASALMRVTPIDTVIVTFFTSPDGDWTIMIDSMNGVSCMVMWGKYWQMAGQES